MINKYLESRRLKRMEEDLPDLLFQSSSLASFLSFEKVIEELAKGEGELAKEFSLANEKIVRGSSVEKALKELSERNPSPMIKRTINLFLEGYATGADISIALRETAEDINSTQEIFRERATNSMIEKFTLILSGGILVPFIFGSIVSMVESIQMPSLFSVASDKVVKQAIMGNQIYLVEFALIASVFVAMQENDLKKTLFYAVLLVPSAIMFFFIAKGF